MVFTTHRINDELSPYIESIFHFKNFIPDHSIERVVPTGHSFLIFELDGMKRNTFDNDSLESLKTFQKAWYSGIHKNYLSISAHEKSEMLVVQFKPYGARPFTNRLASDLKDRVVAADEIFTESVYFLREKIKEVENAEQKFGLVEKYLLSHFDISKTCPENIVQCVKKISKEAFEESERIVEAYTGSQKHLINQFKNYIGLTPKSLHRIFRFNDILPKIHKKETIEWSEIAYQCGFSDQSHFIKEFKFFSGFNPKEFIKNNFHTDQNNFFPLDRKG